MFLYRNILKRALKLTWKFKYLWFFGLFAFLIDNGGELQVMIRGLDLNFNEGFMGTLRQFAETGVFSVSTLGNIGALFKSDPLTLFISLTVLLIVAALGLFLLWLSVVSQAAVVNNTARDIAGKEHDFQEGLLAGIKNFWPVLGLNAILKVVLYLIFILVSLPLISSAFGPDYKEGNLLFLVMFIVFVPLAILLSFIFKYSIAFAVIKGEKFVEAIRHGWMLFIDNWLVSLEMAFILFFIDLFYYLLLFWIILIISVPFIFVIGVLTNLALMFNSGVILSFSIITILLVTLITRSIISTFQISSWTGLFVELTGRGAVSKIVRVFGK